MQIDKNYTEGTEWAEEETSRRKRFIHLNFLSALLIGQNRDPQEKRRGLLVSLALETNTIGKKLSLMPSPDRYS